VSQAELSAQVQEENKVVALEEEAKSAVAIIGDLQRQLYFRLDLQMQRHSLCSRTNWEEIYSRQELYYH